VRKKMTAMPVMSVNETESLKREIAAKQAYVDKAEGKLPVGEAELAINEIADVNLNPIKADIARKKNALDSMNPENHKLTGAQRQAAEKKWKELGDWLSDKMLTLAEQGAFPSSKDDVKDSFYQRAVDKACSKDGENSREFVIKAQEWQRLGRILWPTDPEKSNTSRLRKEGSTSGRHF